MMTRSEGDDEESFEEAPYEKSQNEGLNLILFQGANNIMSSEQGAEEEPEEEKNGVDQDD